MNACEITENSQQFHAISIPFTSIFVRRRFNGSSPQPDYPSHGSFAHRRRARPCSSAGANEIRSGRRRSREKVELHGFVGEAVHSPADAARRSPVRSAESFVQKL